MEETWKDIKFVDLDGTEYDYTGRYQVSNMGTVKSLDYVKTFETSNHITNYTMTRVFKGKIMQPKLNQNGYLRIGLTDGEGKRKWFSIHRLVAFMFLDYPNIPLELIPQVNHKDEVKTNNCVDNLEWMTCKENNNYGTRSERSSQTQKGRVFSEEQRRNMSEAQKRIPKEKRHHGQQHHASKPIVGINLKTGDIIELESISQANDFFGSKSAGAAIGRQLAGKCNTSYGYKWYYKENYNK